MKYTIDDIKSFPLETGIYKIYFNNSINNKVYIGSASGRYGFYGKTVNLNAKVWLFLMVKCRLIKQVYHLGIHKTST